jgi:hypothetical protein
LDRNGSPLRPALSRVFFVDGALSPYNDPPRAAHI